MRVDFLGTSLDSLDMRDALRKVDEFIHNGKPCHIMVANANKFWMVRHDPRLAAIARQADMILPERAIVVCARILGAPLKDDVAGVAFAKELLPYCQKQGHSIYFLGARPEVLTQMVDKIRCDYPALNVAGCHHGYFIKDSNDAVIEEIRSKRPDVLMVALGSPLQEYWIRDNIEKLNVPVSIGVGGSFDVIAGLKKDAPQWLRKSGLEWLFRLLQDPRRYWKRHLRIVPFLFFTVLFEGLLGFSRAGNGKAAGFQRAGSPEAAPAERSQQSDT